MNARQFDALAKRLGTRLSRRGAVRLGVGAAIGATGTTGTRHAAAQEPGVSASDRHVAMAFYPFDGDFDEAKSELKPLIRLMQQQPGFITMSFIDDETAIYLVTTFLDQTTSAAGMRVLQDWLDTSGQTTLTGDPQRDNGGVFLRSELPAGCWCSIDEENSCGSDDLYCCAPADDADGICLNVATTCPGTEDDESEDDEDPSSTPTPQPTAAVVPTATPSGCTSEGCTCTSGLDGSCDDGLTCCGGDQLGGDGICMTACPCGGEGCDCIASVVNTCDEGLVCCAPGEIGGHGTCHDTCTCTGLGCACTTGLDGTCDDGLSCCGIGSSAPGSIGACLSTCDTSSPCPGAENCECGSVWKCNDGLICCGATDNGSGICAATC